MVIQWSTALNVLIWGCMKSEGMVKLLWWCRECFKIFRQNLYKPCIIRHFFNQSIKHSSTDTAAFLRKHKVEVQEAHMEFKETLCLPICREICIWYNRDLQAAWQWHKNSLPTQQSTLSRKNVDSLWLVISKSLNLNPTEHAFHLLKRRVKGTNPPTKTWGCSICLHYK